MDVAVHLHRCTASELGVSSERMNELVDCVNEDAVKPIWISGGYSDDNAASDCGKRRGGLRMFTNGKKYDELR